MNVRRLFGVAPLIVAAIPVAASARDCNEVKAEIDARIKAKRVTSYDLQIVNVRKSTKDRRLAIARQGLSGSSISERETRVQSKVLATEKAQN